VKFSFIYKYVQPQTGRETGGIHSVSQVYVCASAVASDDGKLKLGLLVGHIHTKCLKLSPVVRKSYRYP